MQSGAKAMLCVAWLLVSGGSLFAQDRLPREVDLARLGLTLHWWGQAVNDRSSGQVEFLTADEQNVYVQARSGIVTAFGLESGRRIWSVLLGKPDRIGYPASTNEEQFLAISGSSVLSLDKMTGRRLWELRLNNTPSVPPEVDFDFLYVGTVDGSVFAYDLDRIRELYREGRLPQWTQLALKWRRKTPDEITSTPISTGTTVSFASRKGVVMGVSTIDKHPRYEFSTDGRITAPVGRLGSLVFVPDTFGRLFCIQQETGTLLWTYSSANQIYEQPKAVGRQVFILPSRRGLEALDIQTGYSQWVQPRAITFVGASDTRVYAADAADNLLVLDRQDGRILSLLALRNFPIKVHNDRTDRIVLASRDGLVICLREQGAALATYHLFPDRQPILPEFAPEESPAP
jgi:outer membrane protein assembly factor BamB